MYSSVQRFVKIRVRFFYVFKDVAYAHQDCIYLIKNTEKNEFCEILLQFKITVFHFNIL